jgi:hypothetical protein
MLAAQFSALIPLCAALHRIRQKRGAEANFSQAKSFGTLGPVQSRVPVNRGIDAGAGSLRDAQSVSKEPN